MTIQWFPGHMNAARRKAAEKMASSDLVIEVLDARIPEASTNPMVHELRNARQRPCLKLLNKADLADPEATRAWLEHYNRQEGVKAVAISCRKPSDVAKVPALCQQLAPHRNDGTKRLRMIIMGIPNVGKSTLLNALLKRKVAKVGDEPAVTRMQQTFDLGGYMTVTDTPGMMWPKIEYDSDGFMLAVCHAIGRNAVIDEEVAIFLLDCLSRDYPSRLVERYGVAPDRMDAPEVLESIGRRRGCLVKGGAIDLEKASRIVLNDFRQASLGPISLETPESRAQMIARQRLSDGEATEA